VTERLLALGLALAVAAAVAAKGDQARAENYGAVTRKQAALTQRAIHAWFDRRGAGGVMTCIARRESGLAGIAYNDDDWPTQSVAGVFQIAYPLWTANNPRAPSSIRRFWHGQRVTWFGFRRRLSDPVQSIRLAWILFRLRGLEPWGGGC